MKLLCGRNVALWHIQLRRQCKYHQQHNQW
jgi:hypothetical protein